MSPTIIRETDRYVLLAFEGEPRIITDKRCDRDYVEGSEFTGLAFAVALTIIELGDRS